MKKLITITAVLLSFSAFAQEMNVHLTDGTIESYPLSQIDSITFNTSSVIPMDGLLAYFPFNGNANDESGNGHNGTVNGPILTTDRFNIPNKAYDFNGNDGNNVAISPFIPPEITSISIWFNPITNGPGGNQRSVLFSNQEMYVNHDAINIVMEDGKIHFALLNMASGEFGIFSNSPIYLNQWHHVVCIIDSDKNLKMFLDNIEQTQTISWSGAYAGLNVTNIGNVYLDNDNFDGALDDVRIYDRALSESEIQALFNEGE